MKKTEKKDKISCRGFESLPSHLCKNAESVTKCSKPAVFGVRVRRFANVQTGAVCGVCGEPAGVFFSIATVFDRVCEGCFEEALAASRELLWAEVGQ